MNRNINNAASVMAVPVSDGRKRARGEKAFAQRLLRILEKLSPSRVSLPVREENTLRMQEEIGRLLSDQIQLKAEIDALTRAEAHARHRALHDALTGLPNRGLLRDRFQQAIALCDRKQRQVALLFLDLDGFKQINDDFGHVAGDRVLCDVAARLQSTIRATDTACRYGGDEFVVLLSNLDSPTHAVDWATTFCQRLATQCQFGGVNVELRASIGVAVYPADGRDWDDLLHHADASMYRARADHRSARDSPSSTQVA